MIVHTFSKNGWIISMDTVNYFVNTMIKTSLRHKTDKELFFFYNIVYEFYKLVLINWDINVRKIIFLNVTNYLQ